MKIFRIIFVLLLAIFIYTFSGCGKIYAEVPITVDLEQLPGGVRDVILNMQKEKEVPIEDRMTKWLEVGKGLGMAVAEMGHALNMEVNEFAKTPVGKWAMIILTWKLLGKEVLGVILTLTLYILLILSFRRFHTYERIVNKDKEKKTKQVVYIPRYEFHSSDARTGSAWAHVSLFLILSISLFAALFG